MKKIQEILSSSNNPNPRVQPMVKYKMHHVLGLIEKVGLKYRKDFKIEGSDLEVYQQIVKYFMRDPTFKGDLSKGLLIFGAVGTGKTVAMLIMMELLKKDKTTIKQSFPLTRTDAITKRYEEKGIDAISQFKYGIRCFDDIGEEELVTYHFKNELNTMKYLLLARYSSWQRNGLITHGTSNYTLVEFQEMYGQRLANRMKEWFNFLLMNGESKRDENHSLIKPEL